MRLINCAASGRAWTIWNVQRSAFTADGLELMKLSTPSCGPLSEGGEAKHCEAH